VRRICRVVSLPNYYHLPHWLCDYGSDRQGLLVFHGRRKPPLEVAARRDPALDARTAAVYTLDRDRSASPTHVADVTDALWPAALGGMLFDAVYVDYCSDCHATQLLPVAKDFLRACERLLKLCGRLYAPSELLEAAGPDWLNPARQSSCTLPAPSSTLNAISDAPSRPVDCAPTQKNKCTCFTTGEFFRSAPSAQILRTQ